MVEKERQSDRDRENEGDKFPTSAAATKSATASATCGMPPPNSKSAPCSERDRETLRETERETKREGGEMRAARDTESKIKSESVKRVQDS